EARRRGSEAKGKLRGFGVNCYIEACGIAPSNLVGQLGARAGLYESATVRVNATGGLVVMTGSHSHGQGHETSFAQVVADMIGIDENMVEIVHGDTARTPMGMGTYGSRSLAVGGSAMVRATEKIIAKAKKIASHLLEASEGDIELKDGAFSVAGTDKSVAWGDVTLAANQVLLQFLMITAYGLDGFAFAAEAIVGRAFGAGQRNVLRRGALLTSGWALLVSAVMAVAFAIGGGLIIDLMAKAPDVQDLARVYLPYMVAAPLLGCAAFMLDGVFIGATRSRDMRNMMLVSFLIYVAVALLLVPSLGNHGLWISLLVSFVVRGVTLGLRYPALERAAG
ncbi:hypothetical protein LCGC14_1939690, partial [marine sediment metagenome]